MYDSTLAHPFGHRPKTRSRENDRSANNQEHQGTRFYIWLYELAICKRVGESFIAPERGTFYRSEPHVSELRRLALESLLACGFQAMNRQGSERRRQRAGLCSGGVWRGGGERAAAEDTCQRCDFPGETRTNTWTCSATSLLVIVST
jgi:hypothetical protein